jgi:multicomponent Na+:H+ antiporter subunit D
MLILAALLLPLLAALLIGLSHARTALRDGICLASALLLPLLVLPLVEPVLAGARPSLMLGQLLPGLDIRFEVEPLGILFAAVAALLWPINTLYSIGYLRANRDAHQTRFYICFAAALFSTLWVAYAGNLLTLFIGYELLTLSTYPLVVHQGDRQAIRAGRVYLGVLLASSIGLLLPAILWTWHLAGTLDFVPGGILAGRVDGWLVGALLLLFVYGTAKAALLPIHRWLPAAMVAPTPVSALLHAVAVVKVGVFTIVKVLLYVFGA